MSIVDTLLYAGFWVLAVLVTPPILVLTVECFSAAWRRTPGRDSDDGSTPTTVILVPAHNEEQVIGKTIRAMRAQLKARERVLVVADNCSDGTAEEARAAGAEVIERHDDRLRGKAHALAFGIDHLRLNPPQVVIVIDADTEPLAGTIQTLSQEAVRSGRPTQAIYLMHPPDDPTPRDMISAFAFRVRNLVRPLGQTRLGLPCQLMGTGMAFPWEPLAGMRLASGNIVEDMQMGIDLAIAGVPPRFSEAGRVMGQLPSGGQARRTQRTRWEHGHLATILRQVPRLLAVSLRRARGDLLWYALDIAVPPLALLVTFWGLLLIVALALGISTQSWIGAIYAINLGGLLAAVVLICWWHFARDIPFRTIASVPLYVMQKLPMYARFLYRRQSEWVRTERD